ncbi:TPA: hypothetical protein ACHKPG_003618 [Escherichia coli]
MTVTFLQTLAMLLPQHEGNIMALAEGISIQMIMKITGLSEE